VLWFDLGRIAYERAYILQKKVWALIRKDILDQCLLVCEHDPVYTIGKSGTESPPGHISCVYVDRGGDITYHGPGQLVGYPLLNLQSKRVSSYIYTLERSLISLLRTYGIESTIKEGFPGVWVGPKKISSIGIRIRNNITYHGFALNVHTDMQAFRQIRPCGLDVTMTSMEEITGKRYIMDEIKLDYYREFASHFKVCMKPGDVSLLSDFI
jgi:lipoate-protein ligase B